MKKSFENLTSSDSFIQEQNQGLLAATKLSRNKPKLLGKNNQGDFKPFETPGIQSKFSDDGRFEAIQKQTDFHREYKLAGRPVEFETQPHQLDFSVSSIGKGQGSFFEFSEKMKEVNIDSFNFTSTEPLKKLHC